MMLICFFTLSFPPHQVRPFMASSAARYFCFFYVRIIFREFPVSNPEEASIETAPKYRVIVAADETAAARKAINFAAKLCQRTNNATLYVVHAIGLNPNTSSFMYVFS